MFVHKIDETTDGCEFVKSAKITDVLNLNAKMYLVVLLDWNPSLKYPRGVITEILDPARCSISGLKLLSLLYGLETENDKYPKHELDSKDLNARLNRQIREKTRLDMSGQDVLTFTIDPEMSTDLDDAISFEVHEFESKRLCVGESHYISSLS